MSKRAIISQAVWIQDGLLQALSYGALTSVAFHETFIQHRTNVFRDCHL